MTLAKELAKSRGGKTALVVSMDDYCRTPWSVAMAQYSVDPVKVDRMRGAELDKQLKYRFIASETLSNEKQKRDALKFYSKENYCDIAQGTLQVFMKSCICALIFRMVF